MMKRKFYKKREHFDFSFCWKENYKFTIRKLLFYQNIINHIFVRILILIDKDNCIILLFLILVSNFFLTKILSHLEI